MIGFIKGLMSPKVGLKLIIRGRLKEGAAITLQKIVRGQNVQGWMQVAPAQTLLELEGSKYKLENLIAYLQKAPLTTQPAVLEASWRAHKKQFTSFRVST